jgi:stage III sporulation protein AB
MLKLLGAAGVLTGSGLLCAQRLRRERGHIRQLYAFAAALRAMEQRLALCQPPMEELLSAAREAAPEIALVLARISINQLENEDFSRQWENMTSDSALQLSEEEKRPIRLLGSLLGSSGAAEQCAALAQTAQQLERFARRRQEALEGRRRVWYTLALSAGALAVVMLI